MEQTTVLDNTTTISGAREFTKPTWCVSRLSGIRSWASWARSVKQPPLLLEWLLDFSVAAEIQGEWRKCGETQIFTNSPKSGSCLPSSHLPQCNTKGLSEPLFRASLMWQSRSNQKSPRKSGSHWQVEFSDLSNQTGQTHKALSSLVRPSPHSFY